MPTSNSSPMPNPYVGPRPFETGEHLFGREQEITKLYYVLNADRIVLLYSPSGAGKSSMIQAGLLPRLRDSFDVWRPTRVNLPRPDAVPENVNRYILSAALGFEQSIPEELRRRPEELAGMRLTDCIRTRKRRKTAPKNVLLIFDQFEEILTVDPLAVEAKQEFFDQLGEVLRDPTRWALFAMREDYLAPLDPYVDRVPTHLQNRFRIDLLGRDEAREAIAQPSQEGGRVFEDAAVGKLVNDLATMKVQQPDGSFLDQVGLHVEPLQLQVVCRGLWERLPSEKLSIGVDDVTELGNVTEALSTYYSMEVGKIANGEESVERNIRQWVGDKLITPDGNRGQVLRGPGKTEGLANTLVAKLVDTHLVRAEHRAGAIWYELAHDRLIDPTRADNTQWLDAHLNQTQKRASLWAAQGQPDGLLLLGADLTEAQSWAKDQQSLTEDEQRFLAASAVAQTAADNQRKWQRRLGWACAGLAVIAVVCGFALWSAVKAKQQAVEARQRARAAAESAKTAEQKAVGLQAIAEGDRKRVEGAYQKLDAEYAKDKAEDIVRAHLQEATKEARENALAGKLIAQAKDILTDRPDRLQLTTLLALESMKRARSAEADRFLRQSLMWLRIPIARPITHVAPVLAAAFSPDGESIATADSEGVVKVSEVHTGKLRYQVIHKDSVVNVRFSGDFLATGAGNDSIRIWSASTGAPISSPLGPSKLSPNTALCFNPSGLYVADNGDEALTVWKKSPGSSNFQMTVVDHSAESHSAKPTFAPDCTKLTAARANTIKTWNVDLWSNSKSVPLPAVPNGSSLVFSPYGPYFAASYGKSLSVWSINGDLERLAQLNFTDNITSVAFSPKKGYFATADADRTVRLWRLPGPGEFNKEAREVVRLTHPEELSSIVFSPDGGYLASVEVPGTVRLWTMSEEVEGVITAFDNKSDLLVSISTDGRHVLIESSKRIQVFQADKKMYIADKAIPETELTLTGRNMGGKIMYSDISSNGRYVAAAIEGTQGLAAGSYVQQIWDRVNGGRPILRTEGHTSRPVFMFSYDDKYLAIGGSEGGVPNLIVHDLANGQRIKIPSVSRDDSIDQNYQFFFTPDFRYLIVTGRDTIHLLEINNTGTWRDRYQIRAGDSIKKVVVSANSQYLAFSTSGSKESTMQVWRIGETKPRASISQENNEGIMRNTALALSYNGEYVANADWSYSKYSEDRRVRVWDVTTKQVVGEMPLENQANWFAASADGNLLGVATAGGLKVWDQVQKEEVASIDTAASSLLTTFSPDGQYLLTIDSSQNVTSWFWDPNSIAGAVCAKLTSNLTPEQWKRYLPGEPYKKTCPFRPMRVATHMH